MWLKGQAEKRAGEKPESGQEEGLAGGEMLNRRQRSLDLIKYEELLSIVCLFIPPLFMECLSTACTGLEARVLQ